MFLYIKKERRKIMEETKVKEILMTWKDKIPEGKIPYLKGILEKADDCKYDDIIMTNNKNPFVVLMLSVFAGVLGIDRFYIGDVGLGVAKLLTFGGFYIWALVDIFLCYEKVKEKNLQKIINICNL